MKSDLAIACTTPQELPRIVEKPFFPERRELPRMRDAADKVFRVGLPVFLACLVFTGAALAYILTAKPQFEAETTVLIKNSRANFVLTGTDAPGGGTTLQQQDVSDSQISTELQLITSQELMREVVAKLGIGGPTAQSAEEMAQKLSRDVKITPVLKSSLIRAKYLSTDPKLATRVLNTLVQLYLQRHLQAHGNEGSYEFFEGQAVSYEAKLKGAKDALVDFQRRSGVIGAAVQKDLLIQKVVDQRSVLREAEASANDGVQRIANLKEQLKDLAPRITTQMRTTPNQYSIERMNTLLTELQNRRTDLLTKFRPTDRTVKEVDQQIADTKLALEKAQKMNAVESATDVNPLRQNTESELARAETAQSGLLGRIESLRKQSGQYQHELSGIEGKLPEEQELLRNVKLAEDNYLLYVKKREEARIGQAMDKGKIANVTITEPAREPVLAKASWTMGKIAGIVLGNLLILIAGLVYGYTRRTVETPWELESFAGLPVLATVGEYELEKPATLRTRILNS